MKNNLSAVTIIVSGFVGFVQLIFIVLKLVGVIDWSWHLVFVPLLLTVCGSLLGFGILVILFNIEIEEEGSKDGKI